MVDNLVIPTLTMIMSLTRCMCIATVTDLGINTAFRAEYQAGDGPTVGIMAEIE